MKRNGDGPLRTIVAALLCLAASLAPARALAQDGEPLEVPALWRVTFGSGRTMNAHRVEPSDPSCLRARVLLEGGGEVLVPAASILRLEELPRPAPRSRISSRGPQPDSLVPLTAGGCACVDDPRVLRWESDVREAAERHALDPALVRAVVAVESRGDPEAVSRKGAIGLMQVLPTTAADYGVVALTDPVANMEAGCRHLARLIRKFGNKLDLALAAYNAGEGVVERTGGVPPYTETRNYVSRVLSCLNTGTL